MQYNFKVSTSLTADETSALAAKTAEGLEATGVVNAQIGIRVNTELPDDKVEALRVAVGDLISQKLGSETSVELVSVEH